MKDIENDKIEHLLRRAHIPEPSPMLKERITSEAKKVWNQTSVEIPWQIPARRLAVSAVAAVLVISITNFSNDRALKSWRPRDVRATKEQLPKPEVLTDMPYRPIVRYTVSVKRRPSIPNASALHKYTERLRQILNEMQQNGASNRRGPNGGRSRLFPVQSSLDYYT